MQLHVLGPAFGLPSIDPECVAGVAVLQLWAPEGWKIVPTHDLARRLPFLVDDGECIEGFKNISDRVAKRMFSESNALDETQRANSIPVSSFVESNAQTLLDISLYVSYENYSKTRSAFTKILPWYANYIVPPRTRADARMRTEHLGISSIDVDDVHEDLSNRPSGFDVGKEQKVEAETKQRASLLLPRKETVRSLLRRPEHSAVFKLHALADNFFGPLQGMLGDSSFFLGTDEPQALDCFVYGYLALMLYPTLPQDWLAKTMRKKYSKLVRFTDRMHERLKMQTDVDEVMSLAKCKTEEEADSMPRSLNMNLPWEPPSASNVVDIAKTITFEMAYRIPLIGPSRTELVPETPQRTRFWHSKYFLAILAATATSFSLLGYYVFATGLLIWPRGEAVHIFGRKRFADYGHLGAALAGISLLGQQATNNVIFHPQDVTDKPVRVEVEVEVEKDWVP